QWFCAKGIQFVAKKSNNPPPKFPTKPNPYINVSIVADNNACNTNKYGAINKNVNSSGSVITTTVAVNVAGISNDAILFLFSFGVVAYIAKAIPTEPKTFPLPCNINPYGNNSFKGVLLLANAFTCSNHSAFKPWFTTTGPTSIGA